MAPPQKPETGPTPRGETPPARPGPGAGELLDACLDALRELVPLEARLLARQPGPDVGPHPRLELEFDGVAFELTVLEQRGLRRAQVGGLLHRVRQLEAMGERPLVCAERIADPLGRDLRAAGIAYLDLGGNAWLFAPGVRILVTGRPPVAPRARRLGLRGTEVRLLGAFLRDPRAGERTQTELAQRAGIALGAVGAARRQLFELGVLEQFGERRWRVRDRAAALLRFGDGWATKVRPKLKPNGYRLLELPDRGDLEQRLAAAGPALGCLLGGERAAAHLTGYLATRHATLHVLPGQRRAVAEALALAPDPQGPLTLLDRHGLDDEQQLPALPGVPLIQELWIWAECLIQTDERVVQTTQRLHQKLLASFDG
jgi:hypothetical protein